LNLKEDDPKISFSISNKTSNPSEKDLPSSSNHSFATPKIVVHEETIKAKLDQENKIPATIFKPPSKEEEF
jgi:hypothetical protein